MLELKDKLKTYNSFVEHLVQVGFMPLSANKFGYPSLADLTESDAWHTGDEQRDPWQWKSKVAQRRQAACAKLFDKKPGFVDPDWYPLFLAARRGQNSVAELYKSGKLSVEAYRLYDLFTEDKPALGAHEISTLMGVTKESKSRLENALVELQMGMFLTVNGTVRKLNAAGEPYGWPSIEYILVEHWAGKDAMSESKNLSADYARDRILTQAKVVHAGLETRDALKLFAL